MFIKTTPESLGKMEDCLAKEDWNTLAGIAHRLKSSMFLIGIQELEINMATIEQNAHNPEDRTVIAPILERTKKICNQAILKLRELKKA